MTGTTRAMRSITLDDIRATAGWKLRPVTLYASKCAECAKVITSTDRDGSNRRAKYLVHFNWSHNHIPRRARGEAAEKMRANEVSVEIP